MLNQQLGTTVLRNAEFFPISIPRNLLSTIKASAKQDLINKPDDQQVWCTNSEKNAEGSLLNAMEAFFEYHNHDRPTKSITHLFTGANGIIMKSTNMDAVTSHISL